MKKMDTTCETRSTDFHVRFEEGLASIQSTMQYSDCSFIVGKESNQLVFQAHKVILAMASPVFGAMLFGSVGNTEKDEPIPISDIDPESFSLMLKYIYSGMVSFTTTQKAGNVCYAANKYMLHGLVEYNTMLIIQHLSVFNACEAFLIGKLLGLKTVVEESWEFIMSNTEKVLADPSFENVDLPLLLAILNSKCLNISSELVLFNATHKWAVKECGRKGLAPDGTNLRAVVGPALEKIQFLSMTAQEFATGPALTPLLTQSEISTILLNVFNATVPEEHAMPYYFSSVSLPRKPYVISKYTVIRKLKGVKAGFNESCRADEGTLSFQVDSDIRIWGMMIPTVTGLDYEYDGKELEINFIDVKKRTTVEHVVQASYKVVKNFVEVTLEKPVRIKKDSLYTISVGCFYAYIEEDDVNPFCNYDTRGKFEDEDFSSRATDHGVNFYFRSSKRDFVKAFIFSLC